MTAPRTTKSFAEMTLGERLKTPRLWIYAILGAIGLGLWRYVMNVLWPTLEAEHGWYAFQAVSVAGTFAIYIALGLIIRPFGPRAVVADAVPRR